MKSVEKQRQDLIDRLYDIDDIKILEAVEQVLDDLKASSEDYELTQEQKRELDKRRERRMQGDSKTYSLEEVKRRIYEDLNR